MSRGRMFVPEDTQMEELILVCLEKIKDGVAGEAKGRQTGEMREVRKTDYR